MGFYCGSAANLRGAQRAAPLNGAARQRLAWLSRYRALCHLMLCVHEVNNHGQKNRSQKLQIRREKFCRIILANLSSEVVRALSRQGPISQRSHSARNPALLASWQFERLPQAPFGLVAFP